MSKIHRLSQEVINKIAAGEVVERPASVVKELLDNAFDSLATNITVEIENGGIDKIQVIDNGVGMSEEDSIIAFERHATSKITTEQDILNIKTYGFRGEALSSIAAISQVTLKTRRGEDQLGTELKFEGGVLTRHEKTGAPVGTSVTVENLFFNVPARKEFLKQPQSEYKEILEIVNNYAIANAKVGLTLINNGKTVYSLPKDHLLEDRVREILGPDNYNSLIPVFYEHPHIELYGYIGKPEIASDRKKFQYIFVNKRAIENKSIAFAVKESYSSLIPKNTYPIFVLMIDIQPNIVDVNVHPRKEEVKFSNDKLVFEAVNTACKKALEKFNLTPGAGPNAMKDPFGFPPAGGGFGQPSPFGAPPKPFGAGASPFGNSPMGGANNPSPFGQRPPLGGMGNSPFARPNPYGATQRPFGTTPFGNQPLGSTPSPFAKPNPSTTTTTQDTSDKKNETKVTNEDNKKNDKNENQVQKPDLKTDSGPKAPFGVSDKPLSDPFAPPSFGQKNPYAPMGGGLGNQRDPYAMDDFGFNDDYGMFDQGLGQTQQNFSKRKILLAHNLFIIEESKDGIFIYDQHALHERILFDQFKKEYNEEKDKKNTQKLTAPIILNLSIAESESIKQNLDYFTKVGFTIEDFGPNSYKITEIPAVFVNKDIKKIISDLVSDLENEAIDTPKENFEDRILAFLSCRSAYKAGDVIPLEEVNAMLDNLEKTDIQYTCPHGRPLKVELSKTELEKMFKRK